MRNYWFKILLGALGIFAVGMIGVAIVRSGVAKVNSVVHSDEPITIPLGLVPFAIAGERLGKLDHVTLYRESPDQVSEVELTVNLADSLLAQGLSGCRLVADIEGDNRERGVNIRVGKDSTGPERVHLPHGRFHAARLRGIRHRHLQPRRSRSPAAPAREPGDRAAESRLRSRRPRAPIRSARSTCPATPSPPRSSARSTRPCWGGSPGNRGRPRPGASPIRSGRRR